MVTAAERHIFVVKLAPSTADSKVEICNFYGLDEKAARKAAATWAALRGRTVIDEEDE